MHTLVFLRQHSHSNCLGLVQEYDIVLTFSSCLEVPSPEIFREVTAVMISSHRHKR